ncbi:MAG TPA: sigma factor-like helix-turn-helix DNA-binding protein [Glaciihabitans sp.]|jgi:RNA polymerase sigma-70 factor (ECF subfamily)|nr:sigma factor-like helix-turn-helix DNA-binding protein [Glaciihabitans sp.]
MLHPTINLDHATDALDTLSVEHRQLIHLTYYSGFSTSQVANLLDLSPETVDARLHSSMLHLQDALAAAA